MKRIMQAKRDFEDEGRMIRAGETFADSSIIVLRHPTLFEPARRLVEDMTADPDRRRGE